MTYPDVALGSLISFLLSVGLSPAITRAAPQEQGAEIAARKLLDDIARTVGGEKGSFRTDQCARVPKKKWAALLLGQPLQHELKFKPGCDLQGKLSVTFEPFPLDLAVRNLPEVSRVKGVVEVTLAPRFMDQEADLDVIVRSAQANGRRGQEILAFGSQYGVALGLRGGLKKNRGGQISLERYRKQPLRLVEPIRLPLQEDVAKPQRAGS